MAAVLEREVAARNASAAQLRIRAAGPTAAKTLDDFDFEHQPAARTRSRRASGAWLTEHRNVVVLGPPGAGQDSPGHRPALGIATARAGHRVLFADRQRMGHPPVRGPPTRPPGTRADPAAPLPLIIVDDVRYPLFEQDGPNLCSQRIKLPAG